MSELARWSDYELEMVGRLTHPMAYDARTDHYLPVSWDDAFGVIGRHLAALPDPNMAEFYTSGRTSNEAAFLYQLFVREYGTNNFPDCSNMSTRRQACGLPLSIGAGKATVLLDDFDKCDCIFIFGQNPGTNSPRMMTSLRNAARRWRHHHLVQPIPRARAGAFPVATKPDRNGDTATPRDVRLRLHPGRASAAMSPSSKA